MKRKRERLDDSHNTNRLRDLLSSEKEEQSTTATKIEGWLKLADRALGNQQTQKRARPFHCPDSSLRLR
jgi:hypothetical protein